jgi:SAM-dependent methyltransferase
VALDANPDYLEVARTYASKYCTADQVDFVCASIEELPFGDATFDLCWCAHSLYSLPEPSASVRQLCRLAKPGGLVAVLESDTLHHVILPWPVEIELAVHVARLRDLAAASKRPGKFYVGRQLRGIFREAGLESIAVRTFAHDRAAPLGAGERAYFSEYLKDLSGRISRYLDGTILRRFQALVDPSADNFVLNAPDLTATCIDQLAWGRKPR